MASCARCGQGNPEVARFCYGCGAALSASSSGRQERKVVSVLFCDVVGFTASSESADPEDVHARMETYYHAVRPAIESFGGSVEKFIGDAVMAVFGAPVAHEDDAERAVRSGLAIIDTIAELNDDDPRLGLAVRVGINTGEVLVSVGAEGEVLGDAVNTASRVQTVAPVNAVAVAEQTFRAAERVFEWEPLAPVAVKGKREPLTLYRPLRARARVGSDVIRSLSTPLVGRDLERRLLIGTFERAAQQSSCQLVTLVGEPGVGKSRLCAELYAYVAERPGLVRWRQGRCLPYGDGILFWALGEIVKAECGILESDTVAQAASKLEQSVSEDIADRAWVISRLAPLVGAQAEPATQEESFAAWRVFCESLAAGRTTVLVFEDLHWADLALLAFLEHLADWVEGVPLLLLCTARPELYERHATFGATARNAQRINLGPLTDAETAELVLALLERAVLPSETQRALLERAGGNPLYAEEFVRLLADRGDGNVDVPGSVQALIAARLDTLPVDRKSLLQDAAVLGKVFWAGALAAMSGRDPAEVVEVLHELARKELVRSSRASSLEGELEYGFWHVLVRDVCYSQIPRAVRAARHQAAATWIEARTGERAEDLADVLAHHYLSAVELSIAAGGERVDELRARAVHYLALAGERALALDVDQAERQLAGALELCSVDDPAYAGVLERWAEAVQQQGRLHDARDAFERALELHRAQGDHVAAGRILTRLGLVVHRLGEAGAEELFAGAVELLEAEPPGPELVSAYAYMAGRCTLTGRHSEAVADAERALVAAADLGLPEPAFALAWRGVARGHLGDASGIDDVRRGLTLAFEQGLGREAAVIYGNLAWIVWANEGPLAALEAHRDAIAFCERRGIADVATMGSSHLPTILAELGRTEEALAEAGPIAAQLEANGDLSRLAPQRLELWLLAEKGEGRDARHESLVDTAREISAPGVISATFAAAAWSLLRQGRVEEAHALLREIDVLVPDRDELVYELPLLLRCALAVDDAALARRLSTGVVSTTTFGEHSLATADAQLAETVGDHERAAGLYADAAVRWEEFGNVPEHAYALLGQGRCLVVAGTRADEPLRRAAELFVSMGYGPAAAEAQALLRS